MTTTQFTPKPFSHAHDRTHGHVNAEYRTGVEFLEVTPLPADHPQVCSVRGRVIRLRDIKWRLDQRIERSFGIFGTH